MKCPECETETKPDGMCCSNQTYSYSCSNCGNVWVRRWGKNL